jgi:hypothetical protein
MAPNIAPFGMAGGDGVERATPESSIESEAVSGGGMAGKADSGTISVAYGGDKDCRPETGSMVSTGIGAMLMYIVGVSSAMGCTSFAISTPDWSCFGMKELVSSAG